MCTSARCINRFVLLIFSDAEDEKKREEWREQAKKELEEWYARYAEQIEKTKSNNR